MTTKTGLAIGREALKRDELGANEKCRKPSGARQGLSLRERSRNFPAERTPGQVIVLRSRRDCPKLQMLLIGSENRNNLFEVFRPLSFYAVVAASADVIADCSIAANVTMVARAIDHVIGARPIAKRYSNCEPSKFKRARPKPL